MDETIDANRPAHRKRRTFRTQPQRLFGCESAATMVETAILLPFIFMIAAITYDLARLYVNSVYAQEIALVGAKLANSSSPDGYVFPDGDITKLVKAPNGEDSSITTKREEFWTNMLDPTHSSFGVYRISQRRIRRCSTSFTGLPFS